ncbi:DUF2304 domain-containing protein [Rhizobium lusitanum]|uniref:DUF2304 domain-containing protein n=1 Tax=Rhizobium lusitanum TaxID=293958 RepID=A0A7X0IX57_9HYPH|nr:DUF2304 domain-containing protein [Rhizobium lusitanum]MBB6487562.1 hypothetical protein [Rhizobium lusitanum]
MSSHTSPAILGFALLLLVFAYTIHLVRSGRISAHLAVTWIATELLLMLVMGIGSLRSFTRTVLGDEGAPYSLILLGALWVIFLMLESLTRISLLTNKLKNLTQEHALLKERVERIERSSSQESNA